MFADSFDPRCSVISAGKEFTQAALVRLNGRPNMIMHHPLAGCRNPIHGLSATGIHVETDGRHHVLRQAQVVFKGLLCCSKLATQARSCSKGCPISVSARRLTACMLQAFKFGIGGGRSEPRQGRVALPLLGRAKEVCCTTLTWAWISSSG